ncbi:MAG: MobQ family relaxase [Steroidobacteraceae bacterium]
MAIFHMQINTVSRSSGRNAPASAAYRAGERIRNERTGALYDHRNRRDVLHKEIVLPARLAAAAQWAEDRASLWNAAERIESRENSRVAREYMVALPAELSPSARVRLARTLSHEIAERYGVAVDLAVHAPRPFGDPRNFHAHLLTSTREVRPEGFGPKAGLDMNGTVRAELGLPTSRQEFSALRQRWAELVNEHLQAEQLEVRVDARSLAAQGIDREPLPRLPRAAISAERRGERSEVAEQIRERYRARVAARTERAGAEPMARVQLARESGTNATMPGDSAEVRRRQAVRDWLEYRAARGASAPQSASSAERVRREALAAWHDRHAKGGEPSGASRVGAHDSGAQLPDAPGPDRDLSW